MDFFTNLVPLWVSILFLMVIPIPIFLIGRLAKQGALVLESSKPSPQRVFYAIVVFYFAYLIYVTIACLQGWFTQIGLPPRIMVITAIPLLFFLVAFIFNLSLTKRLLKSVSLSSLIGIHLFRLIGGFFLIMGLFGVVPQIFALSAGIGDLIAALTSIFVASAVSNNKKYAKKLAFIWNTFGLLDILMTSFLAFWFTKASIETGNLGVDVLTEFPFCFIPAFAPATIIFLHLCTYRKLLLYTSK
ncbi:MAG: hypothetical protein ACFB0A_15110 [Croceivirga sp.]